MVLIQCGIRNWKSLSAVPFRIPGLDTCRLPAVADDAFAGCTNPKVILNHSDCVIHAPEGVLVVSD